MMNTSQTNRRHDLEQGPVTVRALRSLTRQHADVVNQTVAEIAGQWAIELHDDYEGYLSILISPARPGREGPVYLVSGTHSHIEVSAMDEDTLRKVGCYETIDQVAARLRGVLAQQQCAAVAVG
jgi:hypothetical protein